MSDTPTDRLTRARAEMDAAHARLVKAESALDGAPDVLRKLEAEAELIKSVACHTRALRKLFLATLEAPAAEPPQPATYTADGPHYRRLRHRASEVGETTLVAAIDRLCDSGGTEADVRLVARHLVLAGDHGLAANLLRNVEG